MPSAARGSAHHQPNSVFSPTPASAMSDSQKHALVWNQSASSAREPAHGHERDTRERDADPRGLGVLAPPETACGFERDVTREQQQRESHELVRAEVELLDAPVVVHAARSARSRQISTAPEAVSTKLSTPKPSSATLPAASAAASAITPSTTFQPTVRYSSPSARRSSNSRSKPWVALTVNGSSEHESPGRSRPARRPCHFAMPLCTLAMASNSLACASYEAASLSQCSFMAPT